VVRNSNLLGMILNDSQFLVLFLIIARFLGMFVVAPLFSDRSVPQMIKLVFILWLSLILWFVVPVPAVLPTVPIEWAFAYFQEFFIGFLIGFVLRIFFIGLQFAGSAMDMQMGLSSASAFDPATGAQATLMSRMMYNLATIVFLVTDGHHLFLTSFYESFKIMPLISNASYPGLIDHVSILVSRLFIIAIKISIPIMVITFMLDFSLGLLSRLAPQVNVFFLGFQIKPALGLWIFVLLVPMLMAQVAGLLDQVPVEIFKIYEGVRLN
jgi:flagellar biosynthesis protein FliR